MAKLFITYAHSQAFDRAYDKRSRNAVFAQVRSDLGIPAGIKLGVDRTTTDAAVKNALYVKGSSPRRYLDADANNRYTTTPLTAPVAAPQAVQANGNGRFVTLADNPTNGWQSIDRADLLAIVRDSMDVNEDPVLPEGFPIGTAGADAVVLDASTGTLYFRGA